MTAINKKVTHTSGVVRGVSQRSAALNEISGKFKNAFNILLMY